MSARCPQRFGHYLRLNSTRRNRPSRPTIKRKPRASRQSTRIHTPNRLTIHTARHTVEHFVQWRKDSTTQPSQSRELGFGKLGGETQWVCGRLLGSVGAVGESVSVDCVVGVDFALVAAYAVDLRDRFGEVEDVCLDCGDVSAIPMGSGVGGSELTVRDGIDVSSIALVPVVWDAFVTEGPYRLLGHQY